MFVLYIKLSTKEVVVNPTKQLYFPLQVHATILLCASPVREGATRIPGTVADAGVPTDGPEPTANDWRTPK